MIDGLKRTALAYVNKTERNGNVHQTMSPNSFFYAHTCQLLVISLEISFHFHTSTHGVKL